MFNCRSDVPLAPAPAPTPTGWYVRGMEETERDVEMNWTLEVVVVPVSDLDRSKAFYRDRLGFRVDNDYDLGEGRRVIQLTPPGSGVQSFSEPAAWSSKCHPAR